MNKRYDFLAGEGTLTAAEVWLWAAELGPAIMPSMSFDPETALMVRVPAEAANLTQQERELLAVVMEVYVEHDWATDAGIARLKSIIEKLGLPAQTAKLAPQQELLAVASSELSRLMAAIPPVDILPNEKPLVLAERRPVKPEESDRSVLCAAERGVIARYAELSKILRDCGQITVHPSVESFYIAKGSRIFRIGSPTAKIEIFNDLRFVLVSVNVVIRDETGQVAETVSTPAQALAGRMAGLVHNQDDGVETAKTALEALDAAGYEVVKKDEVPTSSEYKVLILGTTTDHKKVRIDFSPTTSPAGYSQYKIWVNDVLAKIHGQNTYRDGGTVIIDTDLGRITIPRKINSVDRVPKLDGVDIGHVPQAVLDERAKKQQAFRDVIRSEST